MSSQVVPVIHPGQQLSEGFVKPRGLSAERIAVDIGVPVNHVQALLGGRRGLNVDLSLRLAHYFGTSAEYWLDLQRDYDLRQIELSSGPQIAARVRPCVAELSQA